MTPASTIAVTIAEPAWLKAVPGTLAWARRAARAALATGRPEAPHAAARRGRAALSLVLGDDRLMRRLNRQFRGRDRTTNVLAFANLDAPDRSLIGPAATLGDVVLALGTIRREAARQGKTLSGHGSHLIVHGVLHLLGYDHATAAEACRMEGLEQEVLARLGIADPYRIRPAGERG